MALLPVPSNRGILVADDDDLLSDVVSMTLQLQGYRVTQAPRGRIAPEDCSDTQLVILDAHVPGSDFDATLDWLHERGIAVLVMSGEISPPVGVDPGDYLAKPVDLEVLLATVQRMTSTDSSE